jgi:hypothetical protein
MKRNFIFATVAACAILLSSNGLFAMAFSSPTIGGPTGIITTPNAQIGWDGNDLAFDGGFHYVKDDAGNVSRTPKINVSILKCLEIGFVDDMQKIKGNNTDDDDYIIHAKFRFFPLRTAGNSSLAIGYKRFLLNYDDDAPYKRTNQQVYLVATYQGNFFNMPAESSLVFGKTWGKGPHGESDPYKDMIDFSMSFDLDLFPSVFAGYVHSISEFANYSYSPEAIGANTDSRGAFNTGIRIAALKSMNRFKLNFDVLWLDVFDSNRCWGAGVIFGVSI